MIRLRETQQRVLNKWLCFLIPAATMLALSTREATGFIVFLGGDERYQHKKSSVDHYFVSADDSAFSSFESLDNEDEDASVDESSNKSYAFIEANSRDWCNSEFALLNAPSFPDPDLEADSVALHCIRSLQWVDNPTPNAGLKRCYNFLTYGCREAVTGRRGGGKSLDKFIEHRIYAPALQPFMGASRVELGLGTYIPAKAPTRGALVSFPVQIFGAPVLALQYPSGLLRSGIAQEPPTTDMVIRLEQQRRPPYLDCWLIYEILDVRHAFAGDMGNAHVGA